MRYRHLLSLAILSFIITYAHAQAGRAGMDPGQFGNVHVHVVYADNRAAGLQLRVRLMSGSGSTPVTENFTNDQGRTEFIGIPIGNYHVVVSGEGIGEADSGMFELDRRKTSQDLFITVHSTESNAKGNAAGAPSSVAAVDLNVPDGARKEFEKANEDMGRQDWTSAQQRLNRAISTYPQYAQAYNNLAAVYGHLNDPAHERESLEKAVELNDHLVPALVNLAKLCFQDKNAARAETLLEDASRAEPNNPETMTLLAQAQLLNKHFDAVVITARSVHSMPHQNFAVVHYIAARAFERENRLQDALAELQLYLTEEPKGARADHVREELGQIRRAQH
jgi:tetratricopeptide (TPR) repeat protein